MKLKEELLKVYSKERCMQMVKWVGSSQTRFDELFGLFLSNEYKVVQRAAWPVSYCVEAHSGFIKKHFGAMIKSLRASGAHPAVKRNTIRLLQHVTIPKRYQGLVMDTCFNYMADVNEAIAVKAFSITVLEKLSEQYPEIIQEVKTIIEERWNYETPAFRSRARFFLKRVDAKPRGQM